MADKPKTGKKLLSARLGVGALTFVACAAFPGCNLQPPPPCDGGDPYNGCRPYIDAGTDAGQDAGTDAGHDAGTDAGGDVRDAAASDAALDADLADAGNG